MIFDFRKTWGEVPIGLLMDKNVSAEATRLYAFSTWTDTTGNRITLNEYADAHNLSNEQLIDLIAQLCDNGWASKHIADDGYTEVHLLDRDEPPDTRSIEIEQSPAPKKRANHGYVYLVQSPTGAYKIGKSKNVHNRMKLFGVQLPFEIELIHTIPCADYTQAEIDLHCKYADKRVGGEWFSLTPEDVQSIKSIESM